VFGDEFFEFITVCLFEVETRGTGAWVANGLSEREITMEIWSESKPARICHSHVGYR